MPKNAIKIFAIFILTFLLIGKAYAADTVAASGSKIKLQVPIFGYIEASNIAEYIAKIFEISLYLLVPLAIIIIIIAGVKWTVSAGDMSKVREAKGMITNAFIGLIIALLSYFILSLFGLTSLNLPGLQNLQGEAPPTGGPSNQQCVAGSIDSVPQSAITWKSVSGGEIIEIDQTYLDVVPLSAKTIYKDIGKQDCPNSYPNYCKSAPGACYGNIVDLKQKFPQLQIIAATNGMLFNCSTSDSAHQTPHIQTLSESEKTAYIEYGRPIGEYFENGVHVKGLLKYAGATSVHTVDKYYVSGTGIVAASQLGASPANAIGGLSYSTSSLSAPALCTTNTGKIILTTGGVGPATLKSQGCTDWVYFDGGGSTQWYYNFKGVVHQSLPSGRTVANFIAVIPKKICTTTTQPPPASNTAGSQFSFIVASDVHEGQTLLGTGTDVEKVTRMVQTMSKFNPSYIIINGDLYMKGTICGASGGDNCNTAVCKTCYEKFLAAFKSLGKEVFITPGNHDHTISQSYFRSGIIKEVGDTALITLDYANSTSFNNDLTKYKKVFVFAHFPFVGNANYKGGFTDVTKLSTSFKDNLKKLVGKCALIGGNNHVYDVLPDPSTGCLSVEDGDAGGDHGCSSSWCRKDHTGTFQNYNSYTLVQVTDSGFKICPIKETNNFNLVESDCTTK